MTIMAASPRANISTCSSHQCAGDLGWHRQSMMHRTALTQASLSITTLPFSKRRRLRPGARQIFATAPTAFSRLASYHIVSESRLYLRVKNFDAVILSQVPAPSALFKPLGPAPVFDVLGGPAVKQQLTVWLNGSVQPVSTAVPAARPRQHGFQRLLVRIKSVSPARNRPESAHPGQVHQKAYSRRAPRSTSSSI